ncbi:hypothetical protein PH505_bb00110 [Pseudoalteromonas distincta]|uniref:hypothetical protein n=1 Tax=Pseudoalteromonas distincta TaxID=77608 RepID=UPI00020A0BB0|nr:hypothetical protein [Pseudoalteromonas distincta]EGI72863.1 hypothetical protein PH505_bb00110 [Pseudoalteromonas distincta]
MSATRAAEILLNKGTFHTALEIARIFGQSTQHGQRYMNDLVNSPQFEIEHCFDGEPKVKVISINGRKQSIDNLQNNALLFARPKSLSGGA